MSNYNLVCLNRSDEKYKEIHYLNSYSLTNQTLTKNTIMNFITENIRLSKGIYLEGERIKFSQNGFYTIKASFNIESGSSNQTQNIYLFLQKNNNTIINGSGSSVYLSTGNKKIFASFDLITNIDDFENDYLLICGLTQLNNIFLSPEVSDNISLYPDIPSLNLLINQVV